MLGLGHVSWETGRGRGEREWCEFRGMKEDSRVGVGSGVDEKGFQYHGIQGGRGASTYRVNQRPPNAGEAKGGQRVAACAVASAESEVHRSKVWRVSVFKSFYISSSGASTKQTRKKEKGKAQSGGHRA